MKITDDVFQFKIPMRFNPLGYTFCYFFSDSGIIIDTGIKARDAYDALEKQLSEVNAKITDIKHIIPTHFHGDHIGLVEYIRSKSDAIVFAHRSAVEKQKEEQKIWKDIPRLTIDEINMMGGGDITQIFGRLESTIRPPPDPLKIDNILEDNQILRLGDKKLNVYWTPGHAREHICLYDAETRILFSGDHVLPKITSHVAMHIWGERDPLNDYLTSLQKVRDLPVDLVLPGHEYNFSNLAERIEQLIIHHKVRCEEIIDATRKGEKTIYQISSRVSWDSRPWPQMDFWTKRMAATETYAHLVYLRNKNEIIENNKEGVLYYKLT
ncbi:MBL fold metallo-hydrolase [Candidatus Bathyarchaeota archaeon]|nr:MBL fold metallo-hydrolase [Candidatus Bathyarchaeota archaeon]